MTAEKKDNTIDDETSSTENIFRITDELVSQVDRTKKFVVIMIIAIVIAVPVSWHAAPLLTGSANSFRLIGYVTIVIALIFLAIGVRQWIVLSKWTGKYKKYKELQKKIDDKLNFEDEGSG
jgi:hypothetical protein